MRRFSLTTVTLLALAAPATAQSVILPSVSFPEAGTFCGPLQLCAPLVTRGTTPTGN